MLCSICTSCTLKEQSASPACRRNLKVTTNITADAQTHRFLSNLSEESQTALITYSTGDCKSLWAYFFRPLKQLLQTVLFVETQSIRRLLSIIKYLSFLHYFQKPNHSALTIKITEGKTTLPFSFNRKVNCTAKIFLI